MTEAWAPTLADVARHIPTRTRDTRTPGSDQMLGTFTASTTPTDDQAQAVVDDAVNSILANAAVTMPAAADPNGPLVRQAARTAAEWQAAADIEIAYPNRDADVRVAAQLQARANAALATLLRAMAETDTGAVELVPVWQSPDAVTIAPWGDLNI